MKTNPSNIYEADDNKFTEETERLSSLDLPYSVSIEAIGRIKPGTSLLDIGAGPNTSLFEYVKSQGGEHSALDKNESFLKKQKEAGANTVKGDVRNLPFDNDTFDITHARFVIAHLGNEKQKAIRQMLRVTKPQGKALFMDYDWTTAHGSEVFDRIKDFMINGGFLFDADFGAELESEIKQSGAYGNVSSSSYPATHMTDYSQIIKLREAGSTDLGMQGKEDDVKKWNDLLDKFQSEADSDNPPGFYFPGIKLVILTKD